MITMRKRAVVMGAMALAELVAHHADRSRVSGPAGDVASTAAERQRVAGEGVDKGEKRGWGGWGVFRGLCIGCLVGAVAVIGIGRAVGRMFRLVFG